MVYHLPIELRYPPMEPINLSSQMLWEIWHEQHLLYIWKVLLHEAVDEILYDHKKIFVLFRVQSPVLIKKEKTIHLHIMTEAVVSILVKIEVHYEREYLPNHFAKTEVVIVIITTIFVVPVPLPIKIQYFLIHDQHFTI